MSDDKAIAKNEEKVGLAQTISATAGVSSTNLSELGGPAVGGEFLLPRISIKHGGTVGFGIEDLEAEERLIPGGEGFKGIIIYSKPMRVLWGSDFENKEEGEQPLCMSEDALTGIARTKEAVDEDTGEVEMVPELWQGQGGKNLCSECPYAQGFPQDCRRQNRVFLLPEGNFTPHVMDVPRTSIQQMAKYAMKLGGKGLSYWEVVTVFNGVRASNKSGVDYTELNLSLNSALPEDAVDAIFGVRKNIIRQAANMPVE